MATADRSASPVDTRRVSGRREVHYHSVDDLLADAQQIAQGAYRTLGNWSLGMILRHLATAINMGVDGSKINAPWPIQIVARTLLKKRFLRGPMRPGYKLPKRARAVLVPPGCSDEAGLAELAAAIERWKRVPERKPHPIFGRITPDEWNTLALRHAELHMSFVVPDSAG